MKMFEVRYSCVPEGYPYWIRNTDIDNIERFKNVPLEVKERVLIPLGWKWIEVLYCEEVYE